MMKNCDILILNKFNLKGKIMNYFASPQLKKFAQQTSDAICSVLHMQVTIVDSNVRRIAGTGCFSLTLDEILSPSLLFNEVIRTGKKCLIESPRETVHCQECSERLTCQEKATLLVPVLLEDQIIGGIGLAAMTDEDKETLLKNADDFTEFMERMAELLATKVKSELYITELSLYGKRFETVANTFTDGILSADATGLLVHFNRPAELILQTSLDKYLGKNVQKFIRSPLFDKALTTPVTIDHQRSVIEIDNHKFSIALTVRTIIHEGKIEGFVAFFQEMASSKKKYESMFLSDTRYTFDNILGNSPEITKCINMAKRVSKSNSSILILGESGTGKELFARAIHNASDRAKNNYVALNCSAIPDALLESELFGYEGGSFTGAKKEGNAGKFEIANGGTIFLDEIGDMPLNLQAKLLRVLQDRVVEKIGGKPMPVDVRIIAATNKNLDDLISQNLFRSDLYYRINVIPIKIPPFRERKGDLEIVANYLLNKHTLLLGKNISGFHTETLQLLHNYNWPGNVRELENVVEYAVNMEIGTLVSVDSLPAYLFDTVAVYTDLEKKIEPYFDSIHFENSSLKTYSNQTERNQIISALSMFEDSTSGKKECAKYLKISLSTLYRKLKEYNI